MTAAGYGIFCLEGEWDDDMRERRSVKPLLTLLEQLEVADSIHRDVATIDELSYYTQKWQESTYDDYKVLYLAMHGDEGSVWLGRDQVDLNDLEDMLRGACKGKAIYFGSCLTLRMDPKRLQEFARVTGARAVVGYRKSVPWLGTAAFEVLLLERLSMGWRSDALFNHLARDHGQFAKSLGLVVATKSQVHRVALRTASAK